MCVIPIGISPTDIVTVIKGGCKVCRACADTPHGSRQKYQRTRAAFNNRQEELERCSASFTSSSPITSKDAGVFISATAAQKSARDQLDQFENVLGSQSKTGRLRSCKQAVRYAFGGSQDVQDLLHLAQPEIDAAMLCTSRMIYELLRSQHEEVLNRQDEKTTKILRAMSQICDNMEDYTSRCPKLMEEAFEKVRASLMALTDSSSHDFGVLQQSLSAQEKDLGRISEVVGRQAECNKQDSSNMLAMLQRLSAQLLQLSTESTQQSGVLKAFMQNFLTLAMKFYKDLAPSTIPTRFSRPSSKASPQPAHSSRHRMTHVPSADTIVANCDSAYLVAPAVCCISAAALYQNAHTRKALQFVVQQSYTDLWSCLLWFAAILTVLPLITRIPMQIGLATDDCIYFETALGENLRVPYHYWLSIETFHGFLSYHFKDKAGKDWVSARSYKITIGSADGQIVDLSKWTLVVTGKMMLTMSMLCLESGKSCPGCAQPLVDRLCHQCGKTYRFLDEERWKIDVATSPEEVSDESLLSRAVEVENGSCLPQPSKLPSPIPGRARLPLSEIPLFQHVMLPDVDTLKPTSISETLMEADGHPPDNQRPPDNGQSPDDGQPLEQQEPLELRQPLDDERLLDVVESLDDEPLIYEERFRSVQALVRIDDCVETIQLLPDTGSDVNLLDEQVLDRLGVGKTTLTPVDQAHRIANMSNGPIWPFGRLKIRFSTPVGSYKTDFYVVERGLFGGFDGILCHRFIDLLQ